MKNPDTSERRSGRDRRQKQIKFHKFLLWGGSRQSIRRSDDRKRINLLDRYEPALLFSIMSVLCLSLADGALTLMLIERGAVELNPVMRYYLTLGPEAFLMIKYGLTALVIVILVFLHHITFSTHRVTVYLLLFCKLVFGSVVIWELFLLSR